MPDIKQSVEYRLIREHYGSRTAKRSGVPLINHIDEGLIVLDVISTTDDAKKAYCIHPLVQQDEDLYKNYSMISETVSTHVMMLVMEYRNIANQWLSDSARSANPPKLSPLLEVNDMLTADKVQNRKDFIKYHMNTHSRSDDLNIYFTRWLGALGVSQESYRDLCKRIENEIQRTKKTG